MTEPQSNNTKSVTEENFNGYSLSITTRNGGDDPAVLEELTVRTVGAWLHIVEKYLQPGNYQLPDDRQGSVEGRYCDDNIDEAGNPLVLPDKWGDARVTVWDTYRGQHIGFLLNSDDDMQTAINTWLAQHNAIARLHQKYPHNTPKTAPPSPPAPIPAEHPPAGTPVPAKPVEGVIQATLAPTPNKPQYADGQLVQFTVNKIVAGTGQGTITYALWGSLPGLKYPLMTIFKNKKGTDENSANYIAAKDTLVGLGLSVDAGKIEAAGKWRLIVQASHKDGKEYCNVVSLE